MNLRLSAYYNMSITEQLTNILKNNMYLFDEPKNSSIDESLILDVSDGELYKNLIDNEKIKVVFRSRIFTFLMNTDGLSVSDKSNITIWPVYFALNEIPINKRFCLSNIIVGGIGVGDTKPHLEFLFGPIITELKQLELGTDFNNFNIFSYVLMGVYDKPARADLLNIINSTGFSSCIKCLQIGASEESENGGSRRIFEYNHKNPTGPKRSSSLYFQHSEEACSSHEIVHGVKGRCILRHLKYYNPLKNTCIDYMHSVLLGVIKTFFKFWFDGDSSRPYCLKKFMQVIDTRLKKLRPASYVTNTPRSIYCWNKWRAHEYLCFILYFSLPVFYKIVPHSIYVNLAKLVIFLEVILSPKITRNYLTYAQNIIQDFSKELSSLYEKSIMLSGLHELLHLVECTFKFGPLNRVNCFPFEELNRNFLAYVNGKDLIGEEFIKIFSVKQSMSFSYNSRISNNNNNINNIDGFIEKYSSLASSNNKNYLSSDEAILSQCLIVKKNDDNELLFSFYNNYFHTRVLNVKTYNRIKMNGLVFTGKYNKSKKDDSCFILKNGVMGQINWIIKCTNNCYFIYEKIVEVFNPFYCPAYPDIKSLTTVCHFTNEIFCFNINEEKPRKLCILNLSKNECFISKFNCSHLFV